MGHQLSLRTETENLMRTLAPVPPQETLSQNKDGEEGMSKMEGEGFLVKLFGQGRSGTGCQCPH